MNPTAEHTRGSRLAKPAVALGKIGGSAAPVELRVKLVGDAAGAFGDYQRAYQLTHGEAPDKDALAALIIAAFIESDRGFAAWRKLNPEISA